MEGKARLFMVIVFAKVKTFLTLFTIVLLIIANNSCAPSWYNAGWEDAGFKVDTAQVWHDKGFSSKDAKAWRDAGFTPNTAKTWSDSGVTPSEAKDCKQAGFTLVELNKWKEAGFGPEDAIVWQKGKFGLKEAKIWSDTGIGPADAIEYKQKGLTVEQAAAKQKAKYGSMIYIAAGWFWMGCSPDDKYDRYSSNSQCDDWEKPYHRVYLDAYYIDKNDVTVAEYERCVNSEGCTKPDIGKFCNWGVAGRDNDPINCVDWDQANTYCQWAGKQLPTEAQWEKAARGTDGRIYPWGNESGVSPWDSPWYTQKACFNTINGTCAVGSYPQGASPYGVMDMGSNVGNWCRDWADPNYYSNSPDHNPTGPDNGQNRVFRGSFWGGVSIRGLRTSSREWVKPKARGAGIGFRCVRNVSK